jgi:hypothetical protein
MHLTKKLMGLPGVRTIKKHLIWIHEWQRVRREFKGEYRSFGPKHPDKHFYVIRRQPPGGGLMSNYLHVIGHINIAINNRMIPVVDMQNYRTFYNEEQPVNDSLNPWEYYFEQPFPEYKLNDVYTSKNVILSSYEFPHHVLDYSISGASDTMKIHHLNNIIEAYVRLNAETETFVQHSARLANLKNSKVLGVAVRGTDYSRLRPQGHPIQPTIGDLVDTVKDLKESWPFEGIFLSTEEEEVVDSFKAAFPGRVFAIDRMRLKADDRDIHTKYQPGDFVGATKFERPLDKYNTGLEYLTEVILLSRCHYLVSGLTSGTAAAIYMNGNKYRNMKLINMGVY